LTERLVTHRNCAPGWSSLTAGQPYNSGCREPAADQEEGGSSVGLPVRDLEPDVGVTELAGLAPARQVLAGQLLSGRLDQLGVISQIAAEQSDGLSRPNVATG
jgi:hypothetical protein